jgi:hypothetical protein
MIRVLLALVLLVGSFASPCLGEMKADAAYGVRYAKEQVFDLPQDQNKPYLTVFGESNDSRYKTVKSWFDTNETLIAIKNQTHFNTISTNSVEFREDYAACTPPTLVVRMQAPGVDQPVVELVGAQVPMTADALARHLNTQASSAECFRRKAPKNQNHQVVIVNPGQNGDPAPQPLPPGKPGKPAVKKADTAWPISVTLTVLAAIVGGFSASVTSGRPSTSAN